MESRSTHQQLLSKVRVSERAFGIGLAALVLGGLGAVLVVTRETPQQVAACVAWCESPPMRTKTSYCKYDTTTYFQSVRYCRCECFRSFATGDHTNEWSTP